MLSAVFIGLAAAATAALYICCPALSFWWLVPLFAGLYIAIGVAYILCLLVISWFLPTAEGQPHKETVRIIIVHTVQWVLGLLRMQVHVKGVELLPQDRPFLLVGNHRSNFDPLVTLAALDQHRLAFVSKPENMKIILVGRLIRCASFLSIDRDNPRNAVTTIRQAADFITERRLCMGIYPEGTRSKTGELLEFRSGAFKIAKMAGCPIAVVSLQYGKRRWPLGAKPVHLHVLTVLDEAYVAQTRTSDISNHSREMIAADLAQN